MSSVFFVLWPLYTGRQTYAKLTQAYAAWKVAYAVVFCLELLTRVVTQGFFASRSEEVSFEATLFIVPEVSSLPFILAFCGFISFHFGLLWLHFLSFWSFAASFTFVGDLWLGLSVAYARLTRRLRGASAGGAGSFWQMYTNVLYSNSQLQGHQILQQSQSLMFENIIYEKIRLRKFAYAMIYHPRIREVLTPLTQPCEFSGIALTRSFFSSLFFIALSF